jgi:hypothetical protein
MPCPQCAGIRRTTVNAARRHLLANKLPTVVNIAEHQVQHRLNNVGKHPIKGQTLRV